MVALFGNETHHFLSTIQNRIKSTSYEIECGNRLPLNKWNLFFNLFFNFKKKMLIIRGLITIT